MKDNLDMHDNQQCPAHNEVVKRLDDRWKEHLERHESEDKDVCTKFVRLFESVDRINTKLNWVMGGLAVVAPLLIFFIQIIISHISKGAQP